MMKMSRPQLVAAAWHCCWRPCTCDVAARVIAPVRNNPLEHCRYRAVSQLRSSATVSSGVFTITAAGTDIRRRIRRYSGSSISVLSGTRTSSPGSTSLDAKGGYATAGVMIRQVARCGFRACVRPCVGPHRSACGAAARRRRQHDVGCPWHSFAVDAAVWLRATRNERRQVSTFWSLDGMLAGRLCDTARDRASTRPRMWASASNQPVLVRRRADGGSAHMSASPADQPSAPLPSGQAGYRHRRTGYCR